MMQIGKNGISDNFIESLRKQFKNHENVKIAVLQSAGDSRKEMDKTTERIKESLGKNYTSRIVGYTIFLKKWKSVEKLVRKTNKLKA